MTIPAAPAFTTPEEFAAAWAAMKADVEALQATVATLVIPTGATRVLAATSTAVADANPADHFLIVSS